MKQSDDQSADMLLLNGFVYTADADRPSEEALAIRDGKIAAVGATEDLRALRSERTRVIELGGRMVMPGLIDGHCHATKGAIADLFSCKFEFSATPDEIASALENHIERYPEADVVLGGRWGSSFFERHDLRSPRDWLDARSQGRAVYLRDDSGHNGWANTVALQRVGFDRRGEDPAGGSIVRDANGGEPTGLLLEEADVVARSRLPDWSESRYHAGVLEMVRIANRFGITGIIEADANEPILRALQAVDRAGALSLHVAACITTPYGRRSAPLDYGAIERLRDTYASEHIDTRFAKIYQDGVPTTARTAAMLEPYRPNARHPAEFRGHLHVEEEVLARDLEALELRGFTVKIHTAGDRAVRTTLDAIERAHGATGQRALRHELAHTCFVHPDDLPRFRELNAVADLSPYLWYPAPILESIREALGERADRCWPIRDLLCAGAPVLAGSDWPAAVASMDPWIGVATLVTRRDPSRDTTALWPEQAISLDRALRIFTLDGARALRRSASIGSLAAGKSADLIVLNHNLFEIEPDRIADTTVQMTMFEGQVVYEA